MKVITKHICAASDIGLNGNLFGGKMLSWLDGAGYLLCVETCKSPDLVTVKFEEVIFRRPVKEGNVISVYGKVLEIGNSSIKVYLEARQCFFTDTLHEKEETITSTTIVFVRINPSSGKAVPIKNER